MIDTFTVEMFGLISNEFDVVQGEYHEGAYTADKFTCKTCGKEFYLPIYGAFTYGYDPMREANITLYRHLRKHLKNSIEEEE